jgi:titin
MAQLAAGDVITFDTGIFPLGNPQTIHLNSALPTIVTDSVTIGGSNAGVILDGSGTPGGTNGLVIDGASNVVIKGLQILNFPGDGILLRNGASNNTIGGTNATPGGSCSGDCNLISGNGFQGVAIDGSGTMSNTVSGNYIGIDASGTAAIPNDHHGVEIREGASYNLIGGDTSGERNLISGNGWLGVRITGIGTTSNTVSGNYIGTNIAGTAAISNIWSGVEIGDGAQYNVIGGDTAGERNVISGNGDRGIIIGGTGTMSNTVSGNYIGTDVNGTTGLGNAWLGVDIREGAQTNIIGGRTAGERNIISSNGFVGVGIWDAGTDNNVVIGNYVGTDVNGTAELGNESDGVRLGHGPEHNVVGGATSEERNIISGNGRDGVDIGAAHNNLIIGNYIGTDVSGMVALGNAERGIGINEAGQGLATTLNVIERNLISGNGTNGVDIYGADTVSNTLRGNLIGTDAAGTSALGNGGAGIWFGNGPHHNTIGGSTAQDRNVISSNNWGVAIGEAGTTNNTVTGNFIGTDISGAVPLGNTSAQHHWPRQYHRLQWYGWRRHLRFYLP